MITIIPAHEGQALDRAIALSQEYVAWMVAEIRERYPELDVNEFTSEHDYDDVCRKFPGDHVPPYGCLLIALSENEASGCVALGKLSDDICEIRTLYVRPAFRGMGIGKQLVETCLSEARRIGYRCVRLDTLAFMNSAQTLYRSLGFYAIEPYLDMSAALRQYICFFELQLSG
jgi:ribosomal protein S18 acetylase RimI-like enzyme